MKAILFDMDGLLINSEPLWQEAGAEALREFGIVLTDAQYHSSTGLRTPEWVAHWFRIFSIRQEEKGRVIAQIEENAIRKIKEKGHAFPGCQAVLEFFRKKQLRIGLASSSPMRLIDTVMDKLLLRPYFHAATSAEHLPYGKPHPQVFLDCAAALQVAPEQCLVFEDSFNGLIAAKAAKMKCVVVPAPGTHTLDKWHAADCVLTSLTEWNDHTWASIQTN